MSLLDYRREQGPKLRMIMPTSFVVTAVTTNLVETAGIVGRAIRRLSDYLYNREFSQGVSIFSSIVFYYRGWVGWVLTIMENFIIYF